MKLERMIQVAVGAAAGLLLLGGLCWPAAGRGCAGGQAKGEGGQEGSAVARQSDIA